MLNNLKNPPTVPIPKVLQCKGVRIAIKLEHIFWVQLEELAKARNISLSKYVHKVLGEGEFEANRSSALRCHCLKLERDAKTAALLSQGDINITLMLIACPTAAFVLKDERTIAAHNPAFAARFITDPEIGQSGRTFIRISYMRPFSRIRDFLSQNPTKALNTMIILSVGETTHNCRARLMLVGQGGDAFTLAFLEDDAKPTPMNVSAS